MATSLRPPMLSAYATPPNSQENHQYSPVHSTSDTSQNISPSSPLHGPILPPNFPLATRQLRPPKLPLYVPAVLRPTERAHRPSPLTPPRSMHGSTDSLDGQDGGQPLSRRSTGGSTSGSDGGKRSEHSPRPEPTFGVVEGLPKRDHWKPDANAVICDAPTCHKSFNLFERRHHCRSCGHVFCNTDSHYVVPLDHNAQFHPDGNTSRSCKHCWDRYCRWSAAPWEDGSEDDTGSMTTPSTPVRGGRNEDVPKSAIASSAPRDWSWSTF